MSSNTKTTDAKKTLTFEERVERSCALYEAAQLTRKHPKIRVYDGFEYFALVARSPDDSDWDWGQIARQCGLDIDELRRFQHKFNASDWRAISEEYDLETIDENPDLPWDGNGISQCYGNRLVDVWKYPNIKWNWDILSMCMTLPDNLDDMLTTNLWNWRKVSANSSLSIGLIRQLHAIELDAKKNPTTCAHPNLNVKLDWFALTFVQSSAVIDANLDLPWDISQQKVSRHYGMPPDIRDILDSKDSRK